MDIAHRYPEKLIKYAINVVLGNPDTIVGKGETQVLFLQADIHTDIRGLIAIF